MTSRSGKRAGPPKLGHGAGTVKPNPHLAFMQPYCALGQANAQVAYRASLRGVLHSPIVTYRTIS